MEWTEAHDVLLCREVRFKEPYTFRKGSNERGKVWSEISTSLNSCTELQFKVTQRAVRDRFTLIQAKYKKTNRADENSSGTSAVITEKDTLIEEITEKEQAAEEGRVQAPDSDQRRAVADRAAGIPPRSQPDAASLLVN